MSSKKVVILAGIALIVGIALGRFAFEFGRWSNNAKTAELQDVSLVDIGGNSHALVIASDDSKADKR